VWFFLLLLLLLVGGWEWSVLKFLPKQSQKTVSLLKTELQMLTKVSSAGGPRSGEEVKGERKNNEFEGERGSNFPPKKKNKQNQQERDLQSTALYPIPLRLR